MGFWDKPGWKGPQELSCQTSSSNKDSYSSDQVTLTFMCPSLEKFLGLYSSEQVLFPQILFSGQVLLSSGFPLTLLQFDSVLLVLGGTLKLWLNMFLSVESKPTCLGVECPFLPTRWAAGAVNHRAADLSAVTCLSAQGWAVDPVIPLEKARKGGRWRGIERLSFNMDFKRSRMLKVRSFSLCPYLLTLVQLLTKGWDSNSNKSVVPAFLRKDRMKEMVKFSLVEIFGFCCHSFPSEVR